jgi:hypothetical protein
VGVVGAWGSKATLTVCMHQPIEAGQQACDRFSVASHAAVLLYRMFVDYDCIWANGGRGSQVDEHGHSKAKNKGGCSGWPSDVRA